MSPIWPDFHLFWSRSRKIPTIRMKNESQPDPDPKFFGILFPSGHSAHGWWLFSPIIYRIFMLKEAILSTFPSSALKTFNTTGRAFHPVFHRTDTFAESLTWADCDGQKVQCSSIHCHPGQQQISFLDWTRVDNISATVILQKYWHDTPN